MFLKSGRSTVTAMLKSDTPDGLIAVINSQLIIQINYSTTTKQ